MGICDASPSSPPLSGSSLFSARDRSAGGVGAGRQLERRAAGAVEPGEAVGEARDGVQQDRAWVVDVRVADAEVRGRGGRGQGCQEEEEDLCVITNHHHQGKIKKKENSSHSRLHDASS